MKGKAEKGSHAEEAGSVYEQREQHEQREDW